MGPLFTNLFASCCTSPSFIFGGRFATLCMAIHPMCTSRVTHVLVVMLWALLLCCASKDVAGHLGYVSRHVHATLTNCNNLAQGKILWLKDTFFLGQKCPHSFGFALGSHVCKWCRQIQRKT